MSPIRIFLLSALIFAFFGINNAEADESNLTFVENYEIDRPFGVAISGNYAYVASGGEGLIIVNIEDPTNPTLAGSNDTDGWVTEVAISGNYAYLAAGSGGLIVLNIEDPTNPTVVASYDYWPDGSASGITILGNYAYIGAQNEGLVILNIEDPADCTFVGSYNTTGIAKDIAISGNYAYIADNGEGEGLVIVNIEDPTNPTFVGNYNKTSWNYKIDAAVDVSISGNYAFVAADTYLFVLNITNPTNSTFAGKYFTGGRALGITLSENYAYLADYGNGVVVINIEDLSNVASFIGVMNYTYNDKQGGSHVGYTFAGNGTFYCWNSLSDEFCDAYAHSVAISGDYAYVAVEPSGSYDKGGLVILDRTPFIIVEEEENVDNSNSDTTQDSTDTTDDTKDNEGTDNSNDGGPEEESIAETTEVPSITLVTSLISIGLLAIFRRK